MDAVFYEALKVCANREFVLSLDHTAANIPEQAVKVIPEIICNGIGYDAEKTIRKGKSRLLFDFSKMVDEFFQYFCFVLFPHFP